MPYELVPLSPTEVTRWDELIASSPNRQLFHRKVWLDYLAASRGVEIRHWAIRQGSRTVGYFAGGVLQKGPFRILGSPLRGWGTNFMGPVMNEKLDHAKLLKALDSLAEKESLAMVELEYPKASQADFLTARYESVSSQTFLVKLRPQNPDEMWRALDSTCRNRIRKAMRSGLTVEDASDVAFADDFYDQYIDLMKRKNLVPPYPRDYVRLLFKFLKRADLLFALRVRTKSGRVLATGLYPHDERTMYFWGGASWQEERELCPNELLHWTAMNMGADRGLGTYNTCGQGRFKRKFGGTSAHAARWHKFYWPSARWARKAYEFYFGSSLRVRAWWQRSLVELVRGWDLWC